MPRPRPCLSPFPPQPTEACPLRDGFVTFQHVSVDPRTKEKRIEIFSPLGTDQVSVASALLEFGARWLSVWGLFWVFVYVERHPWSLPAGCQECPPAPPGQDSRKRLQTQPGVPWGQSPSARG